MVSGQELHPNDTVRVPMGVEKEIISPGDGMAINSIVSSLCKAKCFDLFVCFFVFTPADFQLGSTLDIHNGRRPSVVTVT